MIWLNLPLNQNLAFIILQMDSTLMMHCEYRMQSIFYQWRIIMAKSFNEHKKERSILSIFYHILSFFHWKCSMSIIRGSYKILYSLLHSIPNRKYNSFFHFGRTGYYLLYCSIDFRKMFTKHQNKYISLLVKSLQIFYHVHVWLLRYEYNNVINCKYHLLFSMICVTMNVYFMQLKAKPTWKFVTLWMKFKEKSLLQSEFNWNRHTQTQNHIIEWKSSICSVQGKSLSHCVTQFSILLLN